MDSVIIRKSRIGIAAVLVAVALWASNVAEAKPDPFRGGLCLHVGATDVTGGVKLRCLKTLKGTKVWRVIFVATSTSSAASTTTTTTVSSSPSTSTTAVLVPSVSLSATWIQSITWPKAVMVTANVAGTVYFAEGDFPVKTVSDITSASSYRWAQGKITTANAPTSIAIDVDAVINGYYRVYVANGQGVLSAPATNIVTISVPRIPSAAEIAAGTTTTTAALTCAQGGSCTVGVSTGPGGGIVFYAAAVAFSSPGSTCDTAGIGGVSTCRYLEVAPAGWIVSSSPSGQINCSTPGTSTEDPWCVWSGDTTSAVGTGTEIGTGHANTTAIIAISNIAGKAATAARAYRGGTKTDWFLPSKYELNQMCRYAWNLTVDNTATTCNGMTGTIRNGFSIGNSYYSSSYSGMAAGTHLAWIQSLNDGSQSQFGGIRWESVTRPVRAF